MMRFLFFVMTFIFVFEDAGASKRRSRIARVVEELFDEATVGPPVNHEVCFSPEERCDLKLIRFIETAKVSIDVAVFDINLDQLVHVILVGKKKGVRVRVLVDARQAKGAHSLVDTLLKGGVTVRLGRQRGLMHHKFSIVDGKRLQTGSFNYTNHARKANQENQIYLDDAEIVSRYLDRFERSWASSRKIED